MTTYGIPKPKQSLPPGLSEPTATDTFPDISNRFKTPTKEENRSKRRVNKVLSSANIHVITLANSIKSGSTTAVNSSTSQTPLLPRKAALPASVGPPALE